MFRRKTVIQNVVMPESEAVETLVKKVESLEASRELMQIRINELTEDVFKERDRANKAEQKLTNLQVGIAMLTDRLKRGDFS